MALYPIERMDDKPMKEIRYTYNTLGAYTTAQDTAFGGEESLMLVVEPHDFSLTVGGDTLRRTACDGYRVAVTRRGDVEFAAADGTPISAVDGDGDYAAVQLKWTADTLTVEFGHTETVDHYPNCDGEHDRWSTRWVAERTVTL